MPNKPDGPVGVFVAVFEDDESADKGLEALRFYQRKAKIMDIYDDAKILRKDDGKIEVRGARGGRHGAREGAIVGAVLGRVFPPPSSSRVRREPSSARPGESSTRACSTTGS
jgi:uncharacterized membrane protein